MNNKDRIPLIYHPTNVMVLDDDKSFLKSLRTVFNLDIPYLLQSDPSVALDHLLENTYSENTLPAAVAEQTFEHLDGLDAVEHFRVDFGKLRAKLDTPDRFSRVAVAFVDKQMPKMDGLDFCRQVKEKDAQVKLILLTGNAGLDQAVRAFNEGIIDAYISKGAAELDKEINFYVEQEAWKQFVGLGSHVSGLVADALQPLSHDKFMEFFHQIWKEQQKGEFYLMDSSCSFIFFNHRGDATMLMVRNDEDFKEAIEFANNVEAPANVLESLKKREAFPYTREKSGHVQLEADEWSDALVEVKLIPGTDLHYALIKRPDFGAFSFDRYFSEVWPKTV